MARRYTPEQRDWMERNWRHMTPIELEDAWMAEFNEEITHGAMRAYGHNRGWRKDPGVRERAIAQARGYDRYTDEWKLWFREYAPHHTWRETAEASEREYGLPMTGSMVKNWMNKFGLKSLIPNAGRFRPGQEPPNKGKTWDEMGLSAEARKKSLSTCYKKGNMPHNAVGIPIGYVRDTKDGYMEMKVADRPEKKRNAHDNWVPLHHISYEWTYGEIPDGSMVVFLDGDKTNIDPTNLALETKAEHAVIARHHIPYHDRESHEVARALARMKSAKHSARMRKK